MANFKIQQHTIHYGTLVGEACIIGFVRAKQQGGFFNRRGGLYSLIVAHTPLPATMTRGQRSLQ